MLSDQEIVRRLRAIRFIPAPERYARRAPSLNAVIKRSGLSKVQVYAIATTGTGIGPKSRAGLSRALTCSDE